MPFTHSTSAFLVVALASLAAAQPPLLEAAAAVADSSTTTQSQPVEEADYSARRMGAERPESLASIVRRMSGLSFRAHGEPGGAAYLHVSPLSGSGSEIWVDGVPSRNPADLEPAVWDLSAIDLSELWLEDGHRAPTGTFDLRARRDLGVPGRTRLRTQFSRTAYETYWRALSLTTPQAQRQLRADFEEWKNEEGFDFASPGGSTPGEFGQSKLRRFHLGARADTGLGTALVGFGRGRRNSAGELLGSTPRPESIERWTGQVYTGLDREGDQGTTRLRLYGLDWHELDAAHGDAATDGARFGLRASHDAVAGLSWSAGLERWSGVWSVPSLPEQHARGLWVAEAGVAQQIQLAPQFALRGGVQGLFAEHAAQPDLGGSALLRVGSASKHLEFGGARRLRAPSLLESEGRRRVDLADGTQRDLVGGGEFDVERQDRLHVGMHWQFAAVATRLEVESWQLRRGIGLQPVGESELHFVGDVAMRVEQLTGQLGGEWRWGGVQFDLDLSGRALLSELESEAGRGAGWPEASAQLRLRGETPFRGERNHVLLEVFFVTTGQALDDRMTALGGIAGPSVTTQGAELPSSAWLELRAGLRVHETELYLSWDNVLDDDASESLGTMRRPRQLRMGLAWTFHN